MRYRPLLLLALLLSIVAPAAAVSAPVRPLDPVRAYWTADRMTGARTRDIVFAPGAARGSLESVAAKSTAKPVKPSPTPTPTPSAPATTTGASWTAGGLALRATGKVFFTMGTANYVCSGSVVTDTRSSLSLVLTAGHCVYDQAAKAFATNWLFVPAYDLTPNLTSCADATYGCWTASALVVHTGFASETSFTTTAVRHDWAFAVVGAGGKDGATQLDAAVGSFPLAVPGLTRGATAVAFGYPAASPYAGQDLVYCAGPIGEDTGTSNTTWALPCKMTGGASGGPWMSGFAGDRGALSSLNSYRYSTKANMYGPKFNALTNSTYTAADAALANTIVP